MAEQRGRKIIGASPDQEPIPVTGTPANPDYYQNSASQNLSLPYDMARDMNDAAQEMPSVRLFNYLNQPKGDSDIVDPNTLNKMYPEMANNPFTAPTSQAVAQAIVDDFKRRQISVSEMMRRPQGGIYGAARFGTSMAMNVLDPINLGASLAAGPLIGMGARAAGMGAESLFLAENPTMVQEFTRHAADAALGMAPVEGLNDYLKSQNHEDWSIGDSVKNVIGGALGYSALRTGIPRLFRDGIPQVAKFIKELGPEAENAVEVSATAQLAQDKAPDVTPLVKQAVQETTSEVRPSPERNVPAYNYVPINSSEEAAQRNFFKGTPESMGAFAQLGKTPIENDFGKGIYVSDKPLGENARAARGLSENDGTIFSSKIKAGSQIINLEKQMSGPVRDIVKPYLESAIGDRAGIVMDMASGKEVMQEIRAGIESGKLPPETFDQMNKQLLEAGFDGTRQEGGNFLGEEGQKHNIIMMFDPENTGAAASKLEETGQFQPDRSLVPDIQKQDLEQLAKERASVQTDIGFDKDAYITHEEVMKNPPESLKIENLKEDQQAALDEIKALHEQGLISDEEFGQIEDAKMMDEQAAETEKMVKAGMFCMGKDI